MAAKTITLDVPEPLYIRLRQVAEATRQSLDDVFLRVIQVGSPPGWDDAPAEFQADLAALDRLDDSALWRIARNKQSAENFEQYQILLDKHSAGTISAQEQQDLAQLQNEADRLMLCKAQAVALLQWRGHTIPPANQL